MVLRSVKLSGDPRTVECGETHLFVGRNYVMTMRHGSQLSHVGLRGRCESVPKLLAQGPAFVLYALLDFVVVEAEIFGGRFGRQSTEQIYNLKRDVLTVKRTISPLLDVCNRLMPFDNDIVQEDTRP